MAILVVIFGVIITLLGAFGLVSPARFLVFLGSWRSVSRVYLAIAIRVFFGLVLILSAPSCRFPEVIRVLGIIAVVAAVVATFMGSRRVGSLIEWWCRKPPLFIRAWTFIALAFGLFLIYAGA